MKKILATILRNVADKLDREPKYHPIRNFATYRKVCLPTSDGLRGVNFNKMRKEIYERTGIYEVIVDQVLSTERDILEEVGILKSEK